MRAHKRTRSFGLTWLALLGGAACEPPPKSDITTEPQIITMFGLERYFAQTPAPTTLPYGIPVRGRYTLGGKGPGTFTNDVIPAFTEGQPSAYITTEFFLSTGRVWVQPMYVFVTGRDAAGKWIPHPSYPVFSIGADRTPRDQASKFYSAFWRINYVQVPADTPPNKYRSTRQILADRLPMFPGPASLCSLSPELSDVTNYVRPDGVTGTPPAHPTMGPFFGDPDEATRRVGPVALASGWVDGEDRFYRVLSFGTDRFTWDENLLVDEVPLYVPVTKNAAGGIVFTGLPAIGAVGPNRSGALWAAPANKPNFGSLWRVYLVFLPPTAGTMLPLEVADATRAVRYPLDRTEITAAGLDVVNAPVTEQEALAAAETAALAAAKPEDTEDMRRLAVVAAQTAALDKLRKNYLRVALDRSCIKPGVDLDTACTWIDSQLKVQKFLSSSIVRTEILATCPFVTYAGKAVPNP